MFELYPLPSMAPSIQATQASAIRLRKHADFQRIYEASRKQFSKQMSFFFSTRPHNGYNGCALRCVAPELPRVGLTVGKVMGKAVDRNRIKRRMREAIRQNVSLLRSPVDVVLHPRRSVIHLEFEALRHEVATVFQSIQRQVDHAAKGHMDTASNRSASLSKRGAGIILRRPATSQAGK